MIYLSYLLLSIQILYISSETTHDVIIIGAGASGIAAFTDLINAGIDVIILEAENRIGGRISSVIFGENFVDLGGQWLDGSNNTVFKLADGLNLIEKSNFTSMVYLYSNRKVIPDDLITELENIGMDIYKCQDSKEGIAVDIFAIKKYKELTSNLNISDEFPDLIDDFFVHIKQEILANAGAFDWNYISAQQDSVNCDSTYYNWKGKGYKTILETLLSTIPNKNLKNIKLNQQVVSIDWNSDLIKITCKDKTYYYAKKVIFTPSLGVLKSKMDMFNPKLPENKIRAINSLGIGAVAKVYLEYNNDWFNKNVKLDVVHLIWEKNTVKSIDKFKTNDGKIWIVDLSDILVVEHNLNVLCLWFVGSSVPFIENLDEKELMEGIEFALDLFFGDQFVVPKPIKILRSKWYNNENFLGTYSYQTIESRKYPSSKDLSEPLKRNGKEVIYFAGEATCPDNYGTVHGAIYTGFRESENVKKAIL